MFENGKGQITKIATTLLRSSNGLCIQKLMNMSEVSSEAVVVTVTPIVKSN